MNNGHCWTYENLWLKAHLYMQRALGEQREDELFPLWATIALELVGRASLAYIHPALLAEGRDGANILFAFGYHNDPSYVPISIPTKTVFDRCESVISDFTAIDKLFCKQLTIRRNEELHSGGSGFEEYPTNKWLSNYYRILRILLAHQGKSLIDLLGKTEGNAAEEMIIERAADLEKVVRDRISKAKKDFEALSDEDKESQMMRANAARRGWTGFGRYCFCPACGVKTVLGGKSISISEARATEDLVIRQRNILPTFLQCYCCGLHLDGHSELDIVGLGGQYSVQESYNPNEYFGIEPEFDNSAD